MRLILLAAALALAVALARGGRLRRLASVRLHRPWLVFAAALSQLLGAVLAHLPGAYAVGLGVSAALAAGFVLVNRRVAGIALLGAGLALNATVIAANGAMPVSVPAATRAGLDAAELDLAGAARHEAVTPRTRLRPLADVVPVPVLREVVSVGDVLAALGIGWFLTATVRAWHPTTSGREDQMAKKSRRRKARAKSKANHGKRPNA